MDPRTTQPRQSTPRTDTERLDYLLKLIRNGDLNLMYLFCGDDGLNRRVLDHCMDDSCHHEIPDDHLSGGTTSGPSAF